MSKISIIALLVVVPAAMAGHFGYVQSRGIKIKAIAYDTGLNNPPSGTRIPGYLGPNGIFYPGGLENTPPGPGPFIAGSISSGGVFYPGGNNDTPPIPVPVAGPLPIIPQGPFGPGVPTVVYGTTPSFTKLHGYPHGHQLNRLTLW